MRSCVSFQASTFDWRPTQSLKSHNWILLRETCLTSIIIASLVKHPSSSLSFLQCSFSSKHWLKTSYFLQATHSSISLDFVLIGLMYLLKIKATLISCDGISNGDEKRIEMHFHVNTLSWSWTTRCFSFISRWQSWRKEQESENCKWQ